MHHANLNNLQILEKMIVIQNSLSSGKQNTYILHCQANSAPAIAIAHWLIRIPLPPTLL